MNNTLDKNGCDPKFEDVKTHEMVFTAQLGLGEVRSINGEGDYPIVVRRLTSVIRLTREGKIDNEDTCASAWTFNPFDPDFVMPYNCPFTEGQVLVGQHGDSDTEHLFKFGIYDTTKQYPYRSLGNAGYKFARELTEEEVRGKK